jgi:exodeoxyribonuclease VII small subunit
MAAKKKLTFEERLQQVEALIAKMESGEMPLEEAMQQYEAGLNALNALEKELTAAQQRLTVLRQRSGEDIEVPMEEQQ